MHMNQEMKFITEAEHIHSSSEDYAQQFFRLRTALGLDGEQDAPRESYGDESYGDESYGEGGEEFGGMC